MDIKKLIKSGFERVVANIPKEDIRRFLLRHERRDLFEQNLLREIIKSFHIIRDQQTMIKLIEDVSKTFCHTALDVKQGEIEKSNLTIKQAMKDRKEEEDSPIIME